MIQNQNFIYKIDLGANLFKCQLYYRLITLFLLLQLNFMNCLAASYLLIVLCLFLQVSCCSIFVLIRVVKVGVTCQTYYSFRKFNDKFTRFWESLHRIYTIRELESNNTCTLLRSCISVTGSGVTLFRQKISCYGIFTRVRLNVWYFRESFIM